MARTNLTTPIPEIGVAVSYELVAADIDFVRSELGGTIRLFNAGGEVIRTFRLSGTFTELGISQVQVDNISAKIVTWLKSQALLN